MFSKTFKAHDGKIASSFRWIVAERSADHPLAHSLSKALSLIFSKTPPTQGVYLAVDQGHFFLRAAAENRLNWSIDFESPAYTSHFKKRTCKNDPLARALNLHKKSDSRILDMSGGLGKDALWIAHCGATVTLLERDPVLAFLLNHAIEKLTLSNPALGNRMSCHCVCAADYLKTLSPGIFDAAYYDPMFIKPHRSAQVKKDMQIMRMAFHALPPLFIAMDHIVIPRWVIKRYKADPDYAEKKAFELITGVVRYEVYL